MASALSSKPFGIQSPEQIAKDYGGNKQKIAQAMQLGIVDPTVGTLAGMFIDHMVAGAAQGQAPQGTVATQVFNPQTPAAQAPGGAGPGGLPPMGMGAPPPDMGMGMGMGAPPPDMPMPPPSPEAMQPMGPGMADGGMVSFARGGESRLLDLQSLLPFPEAGLPEGVGFAEGGVASLPVPDDMFNSSVGDSDMQQYADGGMVAFARAGEVAPRGPWFEQQAEEAVPGIQVTSRRRSAAHNAQVGGAPNSYHLTDNARDFVPPKGMSMAIMHKTLKNQFGAGYDVINEGDHIHVEPSNRRATSAAAPRPAAPPAPTATAGLGNLVAQGGPSEEMQAMYDTMQAETAQRSKDRAADKRDRRQAGWAALAQQGLAMLSPEGAGMPSLFADGGTVPGYAASGEVKDPYNRGNIQAQIDRLDALAPQSTVRRDKAMATLDSEASDEHYRTERKQSANMALMNFGLALMATKSPNFLGAIGEAGAPAVAGMKADLRDLKKEARDATFEAAQLEGFSNKEAREKVAAAEAGIARTVATAQVERQFNEGVRQFGITSMISATEARARLEAARTATRPTEFEYMLRLLNGTPAEKQAVTKVLNAKAEAQAQAQAASAGGYPGALKQNGGGGGGGGGASTSGWGDATEVK